MHIHKRTACKIDLANREGTLTIEVLTAPGEKPKRKAEIPDQPDKFDSELRIATAFITHCSSEKMRLVYLDERSILFCPNCGLRLKLNGTITIGELYDAVRAPVEEYSPLFTQSTTDQTMLRS